MLDAGVYEDQLVSLGIEGEVFVFQSFAVETDQAPRLAEAGGELVHYAAFDSAVVMLGALADLGEFELVDAVGEEFVQGEGEGALEGCRRAEAGTEGDISRKYGVESFYLTAALDGLAADTEDVSGPLLLGSILLVEPELGLGVIVEAVGAYLAGAVEFDLGNYAFVDGAGEYIAAVIIRVLAYEVDSACRGELGAALSEEGDELFVNLVLH